MTHTIRDTQFDRLIEAAEHALAFMADPEGLASVRDAWRLELRAALGLVSSATFWIVVVTLPEGRQIEVPVAPDNRMRARRIAQLYRDRGLSAVVVKRHAWASA